MTVTKQLSPVKIYFENLNAIRFIAALLVIVFHTEKLKLFLYVPNYSGNRVVSIIGSLGVVLFFVLSGFLISFLLFKEQEITKTISIKDFYIRRILRIWPLYVLIVILALFIIPFINFFTITGFERNIVYDNLIYKLLLYIFFLPNMVLALYALIPYASQLWSIGAEEQFYLVWPFLNKKINNKWLLLSGVIFIYLIIKFYVPFLIPSGIYRDIFVKFWESMPIDCMAIGGVFALIIHETSSFTLLIRKILFNKLFQWMILILTVSLIYLGIHFPYFQFEVYSVLFGILICNFAANKNRIFSMENSLTNFLGKISYGLYMFHPLAIVFSIKILTILHLESNYILYPVILILVIIMSALSYEFFEKKFLNKKLKYSKLISGDSVKD
ncbi:MAG: acyltransferase [Ignavibacteria bacterium]|nr:acyltransferase [Ignavibacteria bacterium]